MQPHNKPKVRRFFVKAKLGHVTVLQASVTTWEKAWNALRRFRKQGFGVTLAQMQVPEETIDEVSLMRNRRRWEPVK